MSIDIKDSATVYFSFMLETRRFQQLIMLFDEWFYEF